MLETTLKPNDTEERCGLILSDGSIIEIDNVADDKTNSYRMDPVQVLPYLDDTVGTWHTHPDTDPNLSGDDYLGFLSWPKLRHSIVGRRDGKVVVQTYKIEDGLVIACD